MQLEEHRLHLISSSGSLANLKEKLISKEFVDQLESIDKIDLNNDLPPFDIGDQNNSN